mmetsp:Transcript_26773/g.40835  ORF Transcript_26773/g.40835 Transcript_26773/m.40835 type:complete len:188 (+) Transcript_26773:1010-1573(+)
MVQSQPYSKREEPNGSAKNAGSSSLSFNFKQTKETYHPGNSDGGLFREATKKDRSIRAEEGRNSIQQVSNLIAPSDDKYQNSSPSKPVALEDKRIIGTSQTLEKPYFRLTTAVDPADVRPEEVLKKSLKLMSRKWKNEECDYRYIDEQFRSMRQDLTVQVIQNELAVKIYETHARIALENADLDQFN